MGLLYRKMKISDIPETILLEQSGFDGTSKFINDMTSYILNPDTSFICYDEDQIVGFIKTVIEEEMGHIQVLFVVKEYRRNGIATELIKMTILAINKKSSQLSIGLHVNVENERALSLYEKLGFKIQNRIVEFYSKYKDAYFMIYNQSNNI